MVRTDQQLNPTFRNSDDWGEKGDVQNSARVAKIGPNGERIIQSFSGHERNHLFLNVEGKHFDDISALSGLDNAADSRAFALWDFDNDGWQDIALVNANRPLLNWYRNEIADLAPERQSLSIRLVGGNKQNQPSKEWSARDGYGAVVTIVCGDQKYVRELRCGEGFAAQNSQTMLVGMGTTVMADRVEVRWPSGKSQVVDDVASGQFLTIYENPADSMDADRPYLVEQRKRATVPPMPAEKYAGLTINLTDGVVDPPAEEKYRIYITTATWCAACTTNLPQVALLKERFADQIEVYGIPIDPDDSAEKLSAYAEKYEPTYQMVTQLTEKDRTAVVNMVKTLLGTDALPSTIVTDPAGKYLDSTSGVPTASWLSETLGH